MQRVRAGTSLLAAFGVAWLLILQAGVQLLDARRVPGADHAGDVYSLRAVSRHAGPADDGNLSRTLVREALGERLPSGQYFGTTQMRAAAQTGTVHRQIDIAFVEGDLFATMGVGFAYGGRCAGPSQVVVSWDFYRTALGAPRDPIGVQIGVNGRNPDPDNPVLLEVCGVAKPEFNGIRAGQRTDVWAPWPAWRNILLPAFESDEAVGRFFPLEVYVRARSRQEAQTIAEAVGAVGATLGDIAPDEARIVAQEGIAIAPAQRQQVVERGRLLSLVSLLLGVVVVLGMLARVALDAARQARFNAIRAALGESPGRRLYRQAAESFTQFAPAALSASAIAATALWCAQRAASASGWTWVADLLASLSLFDALAGGTLLALIGLPALALAVKLGLGTRGELGARGTRFRVVAAPVLLALLGLAGVVSVAAGAFFESLRLSNQEFGFTVDGLSISLAQAPEDKGEVMARFGSQRPVQVLIDQLKERMPESTALATAAPFGHPGVREMLVDSGTERLPVYVNAVSSSYFKLLGIGLQGVPPSSNDTASVAVNRAFAQRYLKGENPIGRSLRLTGPMGGVAHAVRISAVVDDVQRLSPRDQPIPVVYVPLVHEREFQVLLAKTPVAQAATDQSEQFLQEQFPTWTMTRPESIEHSIREAFAVERMESNLLIAAALMLALVGVYGIATGLRAVISERAPEMALRRVLGESANRLALSALGLRPVWAAVAAAAILAFSVLLALAVHPHLALGERAAIGMSGLITLLLAVALGIRAGYSPEVERSLLQRLKDDAV